MIRFDAHRIPQIFMLENEEVAITWPDAPFIIVLPCLYALVQLSSCMIQASQALAYMKLMNMPSRDVSIEELLGGRTSIPDVFRKVWDDDGQEET